MLRDLDRQLGRIERVTKWAPRPYKIVVLSDHGQTQGATFEQRSGQTLAEFVAELCGAASPPATPTPRRGAPSRPRGCARPATPTSRSETGVADVPVVLGSGSLGLISIPGEPRRLTREEIDARYPG